MLETELERLGKILAKIQAEKDHRTADLRGQIQKIEAEYAAKERGVRKAIEGLEEATGRRLRLEDESTLGKPSTQELIEKVFRATPGIQITAKTLLQKVRELGATFESPNPEKAIISSLYAVMDKYKKQGAENPIQLVAPRTWVWRAPV
jgi:hypothetical protein